MSVIKSALDHKQVILTLTVLIFAYGVYALLTMPRREDPKFNIRQGLIVAAYPGATAEQIEDQVTSKIEDLLFSYEEVRKSKTFSNSRKGVMYVVVELESFVTNADLFWSKLQHRLNILRLSELPAGVIGPAVESDFGDTIALLISFQSDQREGIELQQYIDLLSNRLRNIRSLSKVKQNGQSEECFYINLDNRQLAKYKIYLPQLLAALKGENSTIPSGKVKVDGLDVEILNENAYNSRQDLEEQIIALIPGGGVLKLKDIATVERSSKEPSQKIRVNGAESILISLEMQNGFNIVDFGKEVEEVLENFRSEIPADIEIVEVVNQPKNVSTAINDFIREFFIAIISVIIVILLLLPFRVALIAAAAIPITVAFTFGILDGVGIQLQQVSLASLIVVLGMLVDDAIVIADNYVEKLDEGIPNYDAAWQSANQLKIPMFTAGLTIVGAFAPLLLLSGYVGEFIVSLPLTVAIAINASFIVAMFLTPYLCYKFIKKGLSSATKVKKRKSFLDYLQIGFDKALDFSFRRPKLIISISIITVIIGGGLFILLKQKLFPAAERDQFVIEMRMKEGTALSEMDRQVMLVEKFISEDHRLKSYASFVGTSAPRFYYNYAQKFPQTNIAQILVNTHSNNETEEWVEDLENSLQPRFPNVDVIVKKMVQGPTVEAPVEIRISGDDNTTLQMLGDSVKQILMSTPLASNVAIDFYEKQLSLDIQSRKAAANQLGLSDAAISRELLLAYQGMPVGVIWEGKTPLNIIVRDKAIQSQTIEDVKAFYVTSPITGASVPLYQVADVEPVWVSSNLRKRNGVKTLTVLAQAHSEVLPSEILSEVKGRLDHVNLPSGYSISIGGEDENQRETFAEMTQVMMISLFLIFIIILIQFKQLNQVLIVLAAIPLSIFGASFGLLVSGYPFGFTAFVGLASLVGVSVRNSIILVDFANELMQKEGMNSRDAAIHAGKRRIRPIFLTTMAAAIGVTPMIISGSPMWAPLATVLAIGLIFSMFMTLMTIPVLYWKYGNKPMKLSKVAKSAIVLFTVSLLVNIESTAQNISLDQCVTLAKSNNQQLELLAIEIEKKELEIEQVNTNYLPKVMLDGGYFWYYNSARTTDVEISLVDLPLIGGVPPIGLGTEFTIPEGNRFIGVANLGIYQPITQIFKIKSGADVKMSELKILKNKYLEAESEVRGGVAKLYAGIAIEEIKISSYEEQLDLVKEQMRQAEKAIDEGELLNIFSVGLKADMMDHQTKLGQADIDRKAYVMQLNRILNFNLDSVWSVEQIAIDTVATRRLLQIAIDDSIIFRNTEVKNASLLVDQASSGVGYYKKQMIPDLTLTAQGFYFDNVPLIPQNNVFVGATLSWPLLQWGKRNKDVSISNLRLKQANIQYSEKQKEILSSIKTKVEELSNAMDLLTTAEQAYRFRQEELRVKTDAYANGLISYNDFSDVQEKNLETQTLLVKAKANIVVKEFELRGLIAK